MKLDKYLKFDNKTIVVSVIIVLVIVIIYRSREYFEKFQNDNTEKIKSQTSTGLLFGNSLILRDGSNLEISNFAPNSNKINAILNSENMGPTALPSGEIKITLNFTKRIEGLRLQGFDKFSVKYSMDDEIYLNANDGTVNETTEQLNTLYVNEQPNSVKTYTLLLNKDGDKIQARYIKIKLDDTSSKAEDVKVELYGMNTNTADKTTLMSNVYSIVGMEMYNEDNYPIQNNEWSAESGHRRPHMVIKMPGEDIDSIGNTNYLVSYISFNSNAHGFKIKYSSTNTKSVHTIPCNELINGSINENVSETYFLPQPTLLNYIALYPIGGTIDGNNYTIKNVKVFGRLINSNDYNRYLSQSSPKCETFKNVSSVEGFSNNTDSSVLLENLQKTDKLCRALEYQDQIRNEKNKLERNKQYLIKLKSQEEEIVKLEKLIRDLKTARKSRQDTKDLYNLARFEKQAGEEARVTDLVQNRLDNQKKMSVNLNIIPQQ